jgi:cysteine-rich repeat protein
MRSCPSGVRLVLVTVAFLSFSRTATACNQAYWTEAGSTASLRFADTCGNGVATLLGPLSGQQPEGIALDVAGGKVYWTDNNGHDVYRGNLDGSGTPELLVDLPLTAQLCGIALDVGAGKMYWAAAGDCGSTGKIQRANLDGTAPEDILTGIAPGCGLALDLTAGKIYWGDHNGICNNTSTARISRANLNGTMVENLVTGIPHSPGLALDPVDGKIYFTESGVAGSIKRANLNGSQVELLVANLDLPVGVSLDVAGGKMYWALEGSDPGQGKIQRAGLDGGDIEDLVCGLVFPFGIALDLSQGTCAPCCGDGVTNACNEECDDANVSSGDCCSSACDFESPWSPCATGVCNGAGACVNSVPSLSWAGGSLVIALLTLLLVRTLQQTKSGTRMVP